MIAITWRRGFRHLRCTVAGHWGSSACLGFSFIIGLIYNTKAENGERYLKTRDDATTAKEQTKRCRVFGNSRTTEKRNACFSATVTRNACSQETFNNERWAWKATHVVGSVFVDAFARLNTAVFFFGPESSRRTTTSCHQTLPLDAVFGGIAVSTCVVTVIARAWFFALGANCRRRLTTACINIKRESLQENVPSSPVQFSMSMV